MARPAITTLPQYAARVRCERGSPNSQLLAKTPQQRSFAGTEASRCQVLRQSAAKKSRPGLQHRTRTAMREVATNVKRRQLSLGAGHWLIEKNPDATVRLVNSFIEGK